MQCGPATLTVLTFTPLHYLVQTRRQRIFISNSQIQRKLRMGCNDPSYCMARQIDAPLGRFIVI